MQELLDLYQAEGNERVGFVLKDGTVVEVKNIHSHPAERFDVSAEDLIANCEQAKATFHTHPGRTNNLSIPDQQAFLEWPHLTHYIVGSDGVQGYAVENNVVVKLHDA